MQMIVSQVSPGKGKSVEADERREEDVSYTVPTREWLETADAYCVGQALGTRCSLSSIQYSTFASVWLLEPETEKWAHQTVMLNPSCGLHTHWLLEAIENPKTAYHSIETGKLSPRSGLVQLSRPPSTSMADVAIAIWGKRS
ncbi:hypothetical protein CC2G_001933 [Coprinopsis cinerea AmutBmut pab1-1]|nr:hypothetical protein CC2G_001933 [Coprinopsis cinerea AmutBmut pab1-1]